MADVTFEMKGLKELQSKINILARGKFKKEIETWLNAIGVDFLRVVQDEILRLEVVDTRKLLNSFHKGDGDNVWKKLSGGLGLEAGSNVEYSEWVNDGHNLRNGQWWEGYHYFENAKFQFEKIFNKALEKKFKEFLNRELRDYFK